MRQCARQRGKLLRPPATGYSGNRSPTSRAGRAGRRARGRGDGRAVRHFRDERIQDFGCACPGLAWRTARTRDRQPKDGLAFLIQPRFRERRLGNVSGRGPTWRLYGQVDWQPPASFNGRLCRGASRTEPGPRIGKAPTIRYQRATPANLNVGVGIAGRVR